ncbi:hypothetical protein ES703_08968 [subsurface metagenome]
MTASSSPGRTSLSLYPFLDIFFFQLFDLFESDGCAFGVLETAKAVLVSHLIIINHVIVADAKIVTSPELLPLHLAEGYQGLGGCEDGFVEFCDAV